MPGAKHSAVVNARAAKLRQAAEILRALGFAPKQCNEIACYTFLALLDLSPDRQ
jgi:hypothetical protein